MEPGASSIVDLSCNIVPLVTTDLAVMPAPVTVPVPVQVYPPSTLQQVEEMPGLPVEPRRKSVIRLNTKQS